MERKRQWFDSDSHSISATVRRARQLEDGSWITVELAATGPVFDRGGEEGWFASEAAAGARKIALELDGAIAGLLIDQAARKAPANDPVVELEVVDPETMECPTHPGSHMARRERPNGSHFFSHRDRSTGGEWCNYQPRTG